MGKIHLKDYMKIMAQVKSLLDLQKSSTDHDKLQNTRLTFKETVITILDNYKSTITLSKQKENPELDTINACDNLLVLADLLESIFKKHKSIPRIDALSAYTVEANILKFNTLNNASISIEIKTNKQNLKIFELSSILKMLSYKSILNIVYSALKPYSAQLKNYEEITEWYTELNKHFTDLYTNLEVDIYGNAEITAGKLLDIQKWEGRLDECCKRMYQLVKKIYIEQEQDITDFHIKLRDIIDEYQLPIKWVTSFKEGTWVSETKEPTKKLALGNSM